MVTNTSEDSQAVPQSGSTEAESNARPVASHAPRRSIEVLSRGTGTVSDPSGTDQPSSQTTSGSGGNP